MSVAEVLVGIDGPKSTPFDYTLSPGEGFEPTAVFAIFDGTAAGGTFLPCLTFLSQDGRILSRVFPTASVPAGDIADVTYSPFALSPTSGAASGNMLTRLPINLQNPAISGADAGNAFPQVLVLSGGDFGGWAMVKSLESIIYGLVAIPTSYKSGATVRLKFGAQASTGTVRLQVGSARKADGAVYDPMAFTTETAQNIAIAAIKTVVQASFTLTSAPAQGELLLLEIIRQGNNAADTLADTLYLLGAWIDVTIGP